jgi:hypothetical protein
MLSFMREQEAGDSSANQNKNGGHRQPKASDDTGSLEYLTVATTRGSRNTILVAVLVSVNWSARFMIRKSQPQAAGQTG